MIGTRLWIPSIESSDGKIKDFHLRSVYENYIWRHPSAGEPLHILLEQKEAGFHLSTNRYIDEEEVDRILPMNWDDEDSRWSNDDEWFEHYKDYVIWDWFNSYGRHTPYLGLSAYKDIDTYLCSDIYQESSPGISGIVSGYGKLHEHEYGFRSEFMEILALYITPAYETSVLRYLNIVDNEWYEISEMTYNDYMNLLASHWNIPVITFAEAVEMKELNNYVI
jgi:hypothetical protein